MPRLFTGIEIPEQWRLALASLQQPLPGARWVAAENYHMTLRFAGDIDNRVASEFADFLARIECSAFEARLKGVGAFGGNDPRTLWVGMEAGPELDALVRANERAARAAGLPPEPRNFKPHITIARLKHARADIIARYLQRHAGFVTNPIIVTHFVLFSSRPQAGGGPYVVEERYPLLGGQYAGFEPEH